MTAVLMVLTSHEDLGDTGKNTGFFLSEAAHPWKVFTDAGYDLTFTSPKGGTCPIDGKDLDDQVQADFLEAYGPQGPDTVTPDSVSAADFDAIFYVGGHGTMWDFPNNDDLSALASSIYTADGTVGAVCHGPAGLLNVDLPDGTPLIKGKAVAGFSNEEEAANDLTDVMPFLLETQLKAKGADYREGEKFEANVVSDGRLVTGQNPASAKGVAEAMVEVLSA